MSDLLPLGLWKSALMSPKETFAKEKKNASLGGGVKIVAVAGVIAGVLAGIGQFLVSVMGGKLVEGVIALFLAPIVVPILLVIGSLIGTGIWWLIAKLFGGNGSYAQQYYISTTFFAPIYIANSIPIVGGLLGILLGFYAIYLQYLMLREVHGFGPKRAIVVIAIPLLIAIGLAFVIALVFGAVLLAGLGAGMMGGGY